MPAQRADVNVLKQKHRTGFAFSVPFHESTKLTHADNDEMDDGKEGYPSSEFEPSLVKHESQAREDLKNYEHFTDQTETGGFRDASRKMYTGALNRILNEADLILEVLDARDPNGCRTRQIEEYIHKRRPELKIILVLNKIDLIPKNVLDDWINYLKEENHVAAFKAATQVRRGDSFVHSRVQVSNATHGQLTTGNCVGAEELVNLIKALSKHDSGFGGKVYHVSTSPVHLTS
eukprot:764311-Hanusia_phi.AAC.9